MARTDASVPVMLSLLDRLIDNDPKHSEEAPLTRCQSLRALKASLKRDLEWLLNTRRTIDPVSNSNAETARSLYHYGFTDISSRSTLSPEDHNDLTREIEAVIALFEPRLKRVKVRLEPVAGQTQTLRFVIEGLLRVDPAPERVRFDAVLELEKAQYEVEADDLA